MNNIKVFVAYHKEWPDCKDEIYRPIQVGSSKSSIDLGIQRDDIGDNISIKNPYYSEVTALYYLWKNVQADYKGLNHYRRFFCFKPETFAYKGISRLIGIMTKTTKLMGKKVHYTDQHYVFLPYDRFIPQIHSDESFLNQILAENPIISTIPTKVSSSVREHFIRIIGEAPIEELDKLMDGHPQKSVYKEMMAGSIYYSANMSIMKNNLFNEYCSCIFPLLEKHLDALLSKTNKDDAFLRVSGYIAELLTSVFIMSKREDVSVFEAPVYYVDESNKLSMMGYVLTKLGYFHPQLIKK